MTTTPSETGAQVETSNEAERAKGVFIQKFSQELTRSLSRNDDLKTLASFISSTTAERLSKKSKLPPEELAEFFECLPPLSDVTTRVGQKKDATVFTGKAPSLSPQLQQLALEEMTRAQLLARAADIHFKGGSYKDKFGGSEAPHLTDWLMVYSSLHGDKVETDFEEGRSSIAVYYSDKSDDELMADAYTADPELFADMMVAFGIRGGAMRSSFNQAWRNMSGGGYDNYGTPINLNEEGTPYRPGKRQEDIALASERAKLLLGNEAETKIQTYKDLETKIGQLEGANENLSRENDDLKESQAELEKQVEESRNKTELAAQREEMANKKAAEASELAETEISALKQRMEELLAIAEESVGTFKKDTRAKRIRKLVERPLPKKE